MTPKKSLVQKVSEGEKLKNLYKPVLLRKEGDTEVWCDGEVPPQMLGKNYFDCRKEAHELGLELISEEDFKTLVTLQKWDKWQCSWLESGASGANCADARYVDFYPLNQRAGVRYGNPGYERDNCGAVRLLRVLAFDPSPSLSPLSSEKELIIESIEAWLTEYDGAFSSAGRWKKEFLKFLKNILPKNV